MTCAANPAGLEPERTSPWQACLLSLDRCVLLHSDRTGTCNKGPFWNAGTQLHQGLAISHCGEFSKSDLAETQRISIPISGPCIHILQVNGLRLYLKLHPTGQRVPAGEAQKGLIRRSLQLLSPRLWCCFRARPCNARLQIAARRHEGKYGLWHPSTCPASFRSLSQPSCEVK